MIGMATAPTLGTIAGKKTKAGKTKTVGKLGTTTCKKTKAGKTEEVATLGTTAGTARPPRDGSDD